MWFRLFPTWFHFPPMVSCVLSWFNLSLLSFHGVYIWFRLSPMSVHLCPNGFVCCPYGLYHFFISCCCFLSLWKNGFLWFHMVAFVSRVVYLGHKSFRSVPRKFDIVSFTPREVSFVPIDFVHSPFHMVSFISQIVSSVSEWFRLFPLWFRLFPH